MFAPEIREIILNYRTCEFATITKNNKPSTHPVTAWYEAGMDSIMVTTSLGFPQKVYNIQRNPRVSLLFSNPTGSGVSSKGMVAIQGDARVDENIACIDGLEDFWRRMLRWQPHAQKYHRSALGRYLVDWYYMRLRVHVTPRRAFYWETGDFTQNPTEITINHAV
ncbi:MAG: pyridoxamine 5'-phosphate oxidase family protein [Anaerolineae bacterium]|nr:pyridoxamine 5'-phosphate oxidase family protein [Anaerolineae bacterium]